jgi:hypothetical protein
MPFLNDVVAVIFLLGLEFAIFVLIFWAIRDKRLSMPVGVYGVCAASYFALRLGWYVPFPNHANPNYSPSEAIVYTMLMPALCLYVVLVAAGIGPLFKKKENDPSNALLAVFTFVIVAAALLRVIFFPVPEMRTEDKFIEVVIAVVGSYMLSARIKAAQQNKIRVQLENGQTGTIDPKDFDAATMTRL